MQHCHTFLLCDSGGDGSCIQILSLSLLPQFSCDCKMEFAGSLFTRDDHRALASRFLVAATLTKKRISTKLQTVNSQILLYLVSQVNSCAIRQKRVHYPFILL